jgi:hypothetical protein
MWRRGRLAMADEPPYFDDDLAAFVGARFDSHADVRDLRLACGEARFDQIVFEAWTRIDLLTHRLGVRGAQLASRTRGEDP